MFMQYVSQTPLMLDRELKKGSAELLILSPLEARPRHGYEMSQLIETRSRGTLRFNVASFYPLLYHLENRGWIDGRWVEKASNARRVLATDDSPARRIRRSQLRLHAQR
jgi:DNA-binding PadR family transcriptional regulator